MKQNVKTTDSDQGQKLNIAGGSYRIITSGKDTNGTYALIEMTVPAGAGPVPHAHENFEEIFYVLEGAVDFQSETGKFLAEKGATVSIPKGGIIHNFKNNTDQPAKLLCTVIPAGLDEFFIGAAALMSAENKTDLKENITNLSEKYGQKLYSPDYWDL